MESSDCGDKKCDELVLSLPENEAALATASNHPRKYKFIVGLCIAIIMLIVITVIITVGNLSLQEKMNKVLTSDERNTGINVSVHYKSYINQSVLIYNIQSVSGSNSIMDVFRVFLQFSDAMQNQHFNRIELACHGKTKYLLDGEYYRTLGEGYASQNAINTIQTFPENLKLPDGSQAYSSWEGGWLGVSIQQIKDFTDFNHKWYLDNL